MAESFQLPLQFVPEVDEAKLRAMIAQVVAAMKSGDSTIRLIDPAKLQSDSRVAIAQAGRVRDEFGRFVKQIDQVAEKGDFLQRAFKGNQIAQFAREAADAVQALSAPFVAVDTAARSIGALGVKNFGEFKQVMVDLSKEIPNTAAEIGDAIGEGIGSGIISVNEKGEASIQEAIAFTRTAGKLAVAGNADVGAAVSGIAGVLNAYGESAGEADRISDVLFNTFNLGVASISDLSSYLSQVTPVAAAAGIKFEQVAATIATMTKQGIKVPDATTKIKALLVEMQKPAPALKQVLDAAGVSIEKIKSGELSLQSASIAIGDTLAKLGKSAPQVFGSIDAANVVLSLSGKNAQTALEDLEGIAKRGTVGEGFATQADAIAVKSKLIINSVQGALIGAFDAVGGGVVTALNSVAQVAPTITTLGTLKNLLPPDLAKNALAFAKSIIGGIVPGLFAQTAATGAATTAQTGLNTAMAANPIGLIVLAIAALGVAFYALYKNVQPFADAVNGGLAFLVDAFEAVQPVLAKVGDLFVAVGGLWLDYILAPFEIGFSIIGAIIDALGGLGGAGDSSAGALKVLGDIVTFLSEQLNTMIALVTGVKAAINSIIEQFGSIISKIADGDIFGAISDLTNVGSKAADSFQTAFAGSLQESRVKDAGDKMAKVLNDSVNAGVGKVDVGALTKSLTEAQTKIAELSKKKASGGALTAEEQASLDALSKKADETANNIAAVAPQAATGFRTVVDAQGNLVKQYDVSITKAQEFAENQKRGFDGELLARQKEYSGELIVTASIYEQQKSKLEEIKKAADTAAKAGDTDTAKKKVVEYNELKKKVEETGATLVKGFTDGADAGLLTEDAIKRIAKAQGITEQQAKQQALASSLKKASEAGALTESQIADIAKKYGVSKQEAVKLYEEQKRQTSEAAKTAAAVKDIGEAFNESLKAANANVNKAIATASGYAARIAEINKKPAKTEADKQELKDLREKYDQTVQQGKAENRNAEGLTKINQATERVIKGEKQKSSATSASRKEKESEFAIAKKLFESQEKATEQTAKLNGLTRERERLLAGRDKTVIDDLVAKQADLETMVKKAKELIATFKITGIDVPPIEELLGDPAKLEAFAEQFGTLAATITNTPVTVGTKFDGMKQALETALQGIGPEQAAQYKDALRNLLGGLTDTASVGEFKAGLKTLFEGSIDPATADTLVASIDSFVSTNIGKNLKKPQSAKLLKDGVAALVGNIGLTPADSSVQIGVQMVKGEERTEAGNIIAGIQQSLIEQGNNVLSVRVKTELDEKALRDVQRQQLQLEIELGIKGETELTQFLEGDVERTKKAIEELTAKRITELNEFHAKGLTSDAQYQTELTALQSGQTAEQIALLNTLLTQQKDLRDKRSAIEQKALDKELAATKAANDKRIAEEQRFYDGLINSAKTVTNAAIDAGKEQQIKGLQQQFDAELISKELFEARKTSIEEQAQQDRLAAEARFNGARLVAQRQAELKQLAAQQSALAAQKALALQEGRTADANRIGEELDEVGSQITEKGDVLLSLTESLQGNMTDLFTNLFDGNTDQVKEPFRKSFATLAGGIQRLASAKMVEVLLGSIIGAGGIAGLFATFLLKPLIESSINKVIGGTLSSLLSFPTGYRFDQPTIAMIGDGSRLGGSDREWLLRDDQFHLALDMVMQRWAGTFQQAVDRLGDRIANQRVQLVLRGRDLVTAYNRTASDQRSRVIPAGLAA